MSSETDAALEGPAPDASNRLGPACDVDADAGDACAGAGGSSVGTIASMKQSDVSLSLAMLGRESRSRRSLARNLYFVCFSSQSTRLLRHCLKICRWYTFSSRVPAVTSR
eukprot:1102315-Pleurochrysis_carterae.AAC.2